jgi:hypothetical protein
LLPIFAALPADIDTWLGGSAYVISGAEGDSAGVGAKSFSARGQAEVDFRLATDSLYFRLDLDLRTAAPDPTGTALGVPSWAILDNGVRFGPPEWAMLQIGREAYHVRLGIVTKMIGLEDYDTSNNYFPTNGTMYLGSPGRMVGVETGLVLGDGYDVNIFGGIDWDYGGLDKNCSGLSDEECYTGLTFGADISTLQPLWGTWSGIFAYPKLDYYAAHIGGEVYPLEQLTLSVDTNAGLVGVPDAAGEVQMEPYWGGQLVANVLPLEPLHPMARVQWLIESNDAFSSFTFSPQPDVSASAGLAWNPFPEFKVTVEGKVSNVENHVNPGLFAMVALRRPEPPPYALPAPPEPAPAAAPAAALRHRDPGFGTALPHPRQIARR